MKAICTALLNMAAFVESADDSIIDLDSAVKALEQLVYDLNTGDSGEREYLKGIMRQEIGSMGERTPNDQAKVEFYLNLMEQLD
jgi:hypothetical protein